MLLLASSVCGLFKWRQFEPEVILLAVGWYLRFSRLCCKFVVEAKRIQSFGLSSCFLGKEAYNEITEQTRFFGPSCLSFADHVNGFVTGNRAPGAPKGTKPLTGSAPAFDGPMILFEDVVEVLHRTLLTLLDSGAAEAGESIA